MAPLVSVIIPTYSRPRLLMDRAIPSVYAQTMGDWELLVVGDGTDPITVSEMEALAAFDPKVRFWNLPHFPYPDDHDKAWGLYGLAALNHGLDHARGDWIAVLGDDDEFTSDHHRILLDAADQSGADHVYGISDTYKDGRFTGQQYGDWPPREAAFTNGANLYRRSLDFRYDLTCMERGVTGDADLWSRMFAAGVPFHFVRKVVHKYHRNYP